MTYQEYLAQSDVLGREMKRIRGLLDQHAEAKEKGVAIEGELVKKLYEQLNDVLKRLGDLEQAYWGYLL
ncbi:hypothetical protein ACFL12_06285 [Pseudomonadota bacterium]